MQFYFFEQHEFLNNPVSSYLSKSSSLKLFLIYFFLFFSLKWAVTCISNYILIIFYIYFVNTLQVAFLIQSKLNFTDSWSNI